MAANLYGSRYIGARGKTAWHGMGKTKKEGEKITVEQAIKEADMEFEYVAVPVGFTTPVGDFVQSGSKSVILRGPSQADPTWTELGVTSSDYRFLQNIELARGLDVLAKETGWEFETAAALGKGETIFMTLRTGKNSVFGDNYDTYLALSDGKCAQRALQLNVTPVRHVCQNTLLMGDANSLAKITIAHDANVAGEYRFWLDLIEQIERAHSDAFKQLEAMASVKITEAQAQKIIAKVLPMPVMSRKAQQAESLLKLPTLSEAQREMAKARFTAGDAKNAGYREQIGNRRTITLELYKKFNTGTEMGVVEGGRTVDPQTLEQLRDTPYAVVQAVAEMVDWTGKTSASVAATSSLFGEGADMKKRAWNEALALASR
jgi:phage/plasmid-like protein (TIGR03299 family)